MRSDILCCIEKNFELGEEIMKQNALKCKGKIYELIVAGCELRVKLANVWIPLRLNYMCGFIYTQIDRFLNLIVGQPFRVAYKAKLKPCPTLFTE